MSLVRAGFPARDGRGCVDAAATGTGNDMDHPEERRGAARGGRIAARALVAMSPLVLGGCDALRHGVMNHAGPVAAEQWRLYLIVGAVLVFVAGPVLVLVPLIAWHYRLANKHHAFRPNWGFSWIVEGLIWIPPAAIVIGLGVLLWNATHRLDPYRALDPGRAPLEIQAVGFDWKWLFIYPGAGVAALDELVIPVEQPVHLSLTSGTVMQSLLIPRLAGQIYAMAGMTTELNLAASEPGTFRGANTQFNGQGFPKQSFETRALPEADFEAWLAKAGAAAHPLDAAALDQLFTPSVPGAPVLFSTVPLDLFAQIRARATEPRP